MKGIILAGGMGTRLRPVTLEIPKPLITVQKKPILNYLVELMRQHGIQDIAVLANIAHEQDFERWRREWSDIFPREKGSIFYETKPRGTFGGMNLLRTWLGNDQFVLSNGDELKEFDLSALAKFHNAKKPIGTIALVEVHNPSEYGVPILDGHRVREFLEKPNPAPSSFVSSGLYLLEPNIFDYADFSKELLMIEKDIFPVLAKEGKLLGMKMENARWYDCGTLERWEKAIKEW